MNRHYTRNWFRLAVCEALAGFCFLTAWHTGFVTTQLIMGIMGLVFVVGGVVGFQDRS